MYILTVAILVSVTNDHTLMAYQVYIISPELHCMENNRMDNNLLKG